MADSKPLKEGIGEIFLDVAEFIHATFKSWFEAALGSLLDPSKNQKLVEGFLSIFSSAVLAGINLFSDNNGWKMKSLAAASLTSTMLMGFRLIQSFMKSFDVDLALQFFKVYLKEKFVTVFVNNSDEGVWNMITTLMSSVCMAILGGIGVITKGPSGVAEFFRTAHFLNLGSKAINENVEKLIQWITGKQVDPYFAIKQEMFEAVNVSNELLRTPNPKISMENELYQKFKDHVSHMQKLLVERNTPELNIVRNMISSNLIAMNKKLTEIENVETPRQVTIGVLLRGAPGIGKSSLIKYLAKKIGADYGWSSKTYNMDMAVNFFDVYHNEHFGIKNELANSTELDPFLTQANKIISDDPMNFESAYVKFQPCKLKIAFLTTNKNKPCLPKLTEEAIQAFYDRLIIVEAFDHKSGQNLKRRIPRPHLKPDFSHLTFLLQEPTPNMDGFQNVLPTEVSVFELERLIRFRLAFETKKFYEAQELEISPNLEERLTHDLAIVRGSNAWLYLGLNLYEEVKVNSAGREFFIIRFQGPVRTGKTTTAVGLKEELMSRTSYNGKNYFGVQISKNLGEFKAKDTPMIYILDDWVVSSLTREESELYVQEMNKTHVDSIFLITTNDVISPCSLRNDIRQRTLSWFSGCHRTSPYDMHAYSHMYDGIIRRIGLEEHVLFKNVFHNFGQKGYSRTYTTKTSGLYYDHEGVVTSRSRIFGKLFDSWTKYKQDLFNIPIVQARPENEKVDVDIFLKAETKEELFNSLKTAKSAAHLFLAPTTRAGIYASDRIKKGLNLDGSSIRNGVNPNDFVMPGEFPTGATDFEKIEIIALKTARGLLNTWPDASFRCSITSTKEILYFDNRVIYYYTLDQEEQFQLSGSTLVYHRGDRFEVSPIDFAQSMFEIRLEHKYKRSVANDEIYQITMRYYTLRKSLREPDQFVTSVEQELDRLKTVNSSAYLKALVLNQNNTILKVAIGCSLLLLGGGAVYGLRQIWINFFKEKINTNAFANTGSTPPQRYQDSMWKQNLRNTDAGFASVNFFNKEEEVEEPVLAQSAVDSDDLVANSPQKYSPKIYANEHKPAEELAVNSPQKYSPTIYANQAKEDLVDVLQPEWRRVKLADKTHVKFNDQVTIKENRKAIPHEHTCKICNCFYSHVHDWRYNDHTQWKGDCPNVDRYWNVKEKKWGPCPASQGKEAAKRPLKETVLIQYDFEKTKFDPLTPNFISKSLSEEYDAAGVAVRRFIAELDIDQRKELQSFIQQNLSQAYKGEKSVFKVILKKWPELAEILDSAVTVNMLSRADMIIRQPTPYENLYRVLNQSYMRVDYGVGACYALHIQDDYFLTVAHPFEYEGVVATLTGSGKTSPATVFFIDRDRDVSLLKATKMLGLPKTLRYFVEDSKDLPIEGAMLRCGDVMSIVHGNVDYREYQEFLDKVPAGTLYSPCVDVMYIRRMGMDVKDAIQDGDCGFPFVTKVNGSLKVAGIHNAYKNHNVIYGSFINKEYLATRCQGITVNSKITSNVLIAKVPTSKEENAAKFDFSLASEYKEIFFQLEPDFTYPETYLHKLGYSERLKVWQASSTKHRTHHLKLINENETLPAAVNMTFVKDYRKLEFDNFGRPDPLFTQALKYKPAELSYDRDILEHAIHLVSAYNLATYGTYTSLTEFECLNGFDDTRGFLTKMDPSTGAGPYPKIFYKIPLKKQLLKPITAETSLLEFNDSEVAQNCKTHYKQMKEMLEEKMIPPLLISIDKKKVENISAQDAREGKVRLYNEVDISYNQLLRTHFGGWMAKIVKKCDEGYYSIGQNPFTTSHEIYHRFSQIDGNLLNTDFKRFDKTIPAVLIQAFTKVARHIFRPKKGDSKKWDIIFYKWGLSLTHALHIHNGMVYLVHQGNESGTFVTTLLNCVVVHLKFCYSFIKAWQKIPSCMHITVQLKDIMQHSTLAILGDDETKKVSKMIPLTIEQNIEDSKQFGMERTLPKDSDEAHAHDVIDFCSRRLVWDPKDQVVYPQLKKSSIVGLLYWFKSYSPEQMFANFTGALFEASLHDKEFYESILDDIITICKEFRLPVAKLAFTDYKITRSRFRSYVMNDEQRQQISALSDRKKTFVQARGTEQISPGTWSPDSVTVSDRESDLNEFYKSLHTESCVSTAKPAYTKIQDCGFNNEDMAGSNNTNAISACNEILQKVGDPLPTFTATKDGPDHSPTFTGSVTYKGREFIGEGPSKIQAKAEAFGALLVFLRSNLVVNSKYVKAQEDSKVYFEKLSQRFFHLYIEDHIAKARRSCLGKRFVTLIAKGYNCDDYEEVEGFHRSFDKGLCYFLSPLIQKGMSKAKSSRCYLAYPGTELNPDTGHVTLDLDETEVVYNIRDEDGKDFSSDEELEMLNIEDVVNKIKELETEVKNFEDEICFPNSTTEAPMISGVMPNTEPVALPSNAVLDSDKTMTKPIIMNASAPTNMMHMGGIEFDLCDLVYHQFVASSKQTTIADNNAAGEVIAQIPYDPFNNEYTNDYILQWGLIHERYKGDWLLKVTSSGNIGMQGTVGVAWSPKKISGRTVDLAEMTKFAFFTSSISSPVNEVIVVRDARQNDFFRTITRKSGEPRKEADKDMPHIVLYLETPPMTTFTADKKCYYTFFSRLASPADQLLEPSIKPFTVANPQVAIKHDDKRGYALNF